MKVLSLFDGISCARVALDRAGIPVEAYYASEIDKYAIQVSQKNYPDVVHIGDVKRLKLWNDNPTAVDFYYREGDIDLLIGGSPCQDLSIAKANRKGLDGERSGLFWEYVRILNEVKPKYFILENVASMSKDAKQAITDALYGIEPVMINAALVSAQNRKRLFWVGALCVDGTYKQVEITQPDDKGILLRDILEPKVDESFYVKHPSNIAMFKNPTNVLDTVRIGHFNSGGQGDRIYSQDGKSVCLSAQGGGRGAKTGLYQVSGAASRTYPRTKIEGQTRSKQIEIRDDGKANAMTSVQGDSMVIHDTQIRKLTPTECERLQGLPDGYTEGGNVLHIEKEYGNIKIWNNVLSKIAQEKKKQISVPVLCTTKDTSDIKVLNYLKNKNLQNVDIVIDWQSQKNSVTSIIRIGIGTKTHYTQIKLENVTEQQLEISTGILEILTENGDTEILWKTISSESWVEMKSYTISTLINLIIGLKTSISVQEKNTCLFTTNLKNLLQNSLKTEQLVSKMEHTSLISNTQRYKALGNAFNVDVVAHIIKHLIK